VAAEFSARQIRFSCGARDSLGEAEVDDFYFGPRRSVAGRQHDVARFQIAMDQTLSRRSHQCPRDLDRNFQSRFHLKRTIPPYASLQGFALDQFYRVIAVTGIRRSTELENGSHIRMPQGSRG